MQTNKDKAFRCLHYHLGWVLIPLLAESILSCNLYLSDLLPANISKWSHLKLWPVDVTWSAIAEAWQLLVIALKCSFFFFCHAIYVLFFQCRSKCQVNELLWHAFYCHVYHRSLSVIIGALISVEEGPCFFVFVFLNYLLEQSQQLQLNLHHGCKNSLWGMYLRITIYALHSTNLQYATYKKKDINLQLWVKLTCNMTDTWENNTSTLITRQ